jgi:hypothetical protein
MIARGCMASWLFNDPYTRPVIIGMHEPCLSVCSGNDARSAKSPLAGGDAKSASKSSRREMYMQSNLKDALETLVDECGGLSVVLDALAEVCHDKSEHLQSNWGDKNTAKAWSEAGGRIAKLASKIDL